jgi:predicted transcriptional regulator
LLIPCEVATKSVVPAVRALIAKELVEKRSLNQGEAADALGISQSAVSKYTRNVRGYTVKLDDIKEIEPLINKIADMLLSRTYDRKELLDSFCQTCMIIRAKRLMCRYCKQSDPKLVTKDCTFCPAHDPLLQMAKASTMKEKI